VDINLPTRLNSTGIYRLLRSVITTDQKPLDDEFNFHFNTLEFIEPVGVTVLSNLSYWLLKQGVSKVYWTVDKYTRCVDFLDDSLFFEQHLGEKVKKASSPRSTTFPLSNIKHQESWSFLDKLVNWLSRELSMSRASFENIRTTLQEIFNNIKDHAHEDLGCVFAQHFPQKSLIQVAISDFGVGIPSNIHKKYQSLTDAEAIKKATEQGISTKSVPGNRGAGLDILLHIVGHNKGSVNIHSNNGIFSYSGRTQIERLRNSEIFYPGTLLTINFRTDTIENIEEESEDLTWSY
jgi:anti-sigma regulatory factor (Ser/Thr protein kinase)